MDSLKKRKLTLGPATSSIEAGGDVGAGSALVSRGHNNNVQLPPLITKAPALAPGGGILKPLNLVLSNNSIQAIDVSYEDYNVSFIKNKKKRKKVWIPPEFRRNFGL